MAKEIAAGTVICQDGEMADSIYLIMSGTVRATYAVGEFFLEKGDIIGLCEIYREKYHFSYTALDDVTIASFPYHLDSLTSLFDRKPEFAQYAAKSCFKQLEKLLEIYELIKYDCGVLYQYIVDSYYDYCDLCSRHNIPPRQLEALETVKPLELEEDIPQWLGSYYENMTAVLKQVLPGSPISFHNFLNGLLMKTCQDISVIISICHTMNQYKAGIGEILMNQDRLDIFDLYTSLLFRLKPEDEEDFTSVTAAISRMMIHLEDIRSIDQEFYGKRVEEYKGKLALIEEKGLDALSESSAAMLEPEQLRGSIRTILDYSGCDKEVCNDFLQYIEEWKAQTDKNSSDDKSRKLRLNISKLFYQIYVAAFERSLEDSSIPIILKMFFQFGYVDEELAGMENACYLSSLAGHFPSSPEQQVFTVYEWMKAVYNGEREPSRNEFDADFPAYVHELKTSGKITAQMEKEMVEDNREKMLFELNNMFPLVNKITFGRITSFCPVFSEHNVMKELGKSLVTAEKVTKALEEIRAVDFGAFYRETLYANPDIGIQREYVNVEILPDIILMPNMGTRGVMWQEIEGRRRTTPSRMMISIFLMEDLNAIITRLTGEFRWEMCRRIQGPRWNVPSEPSLTSEYFDYIQFYKKNHELTADAKEKIKSAMQKAKNSYKEMFISDYIIWVLYEGAGSPRLNKVARAIISTYCPFSKEIRNRLGSNPMYKEMLEKYELKTSQKIHHLEAICQKIERGQVSLPEELLIQKKFLES